jgi:hypothetical protein
VGEATKSSHGYERKASLSLTPHRSPIMRPSSPTGSAATSSRWPPRPTPAREATAEQGSQPASSAPGDRPQRVPAAKAPAEARHCRIEDAWPPVSGIAFGRDPCQFQHPANGRGRGRGCRPFRGRAETQRHLGWPPPPVARQQGRVRTDLLVRDLPGPVPERLEGATSTLSIAELQDRLSRGLNEIDSGVLCAFAELLPATAYLPMLLQVTPRLVTPVADGDYFAREQVATWGLNSFWGLPENPHTPYYRTFETPVTTGAHLYEFVVPMVPPTWNDRDRVQQ